MVMTIRHQLRLREVPVRMRERQHGQSSITALRSIYYMAKVLLSLFVGLVPAAGRRPSRTHDRRSDTAQGLDRRDGGLADPRARRLRADPVAPAARAVRTALAPDRCRARRPVGVASGLNTIAAWLGVRGLPACRALRGRAAVRDPRPAALLDRDLSARRPERDPRAAPRAARDEARGAATPRLRAQRAWIGERLAEQHQVERVRRVLVVADDADAVDVATCRGPVDKRGSGSSRRCAPC